MFHDFPEYVRKLTTSCKYSITIGGTIFTEHLTIRREHQIEYSSPRTPVVQYQIPYTNRMNSLDSSPILDTETVGTPPLTECVAPT